jgi:biopolymer transport protein ExbD
MVMSPAANQPFEEDTEQVERDRRKYRSARRKAREKAGEIKELNITAMMDMMTIILVFLLKSYQASSTNVSMTEQLTIPTSTTQQNPQEAINIIISAVDVVANDTKVAPVVGGKIPAEFREGKSEASMLIEPLLAVLEEEVEKQKYIAKYNPAAPFTGRVNVVADRRIPYQTVLAVLYTAGQAELGQYKLMALKAE